MLFLRDPKTGGHLFRRLHRRRLGPVSVFVFMPGYLNYTRSRLFILVSVHTHAHAYAHAHTSSSFTFRVGRSSLLGCNLFFFSKVSQDLCAGVLRKMRKANVMSGIQTFFAHLFHTVPWILRKPDWTHACPKPPRLDHVFWKALGHAGRPGFLFTDGVAYPTQMLSRLVTHPHILNICAFQESNP